MAVLASEILAPVIIILQDPDNTRWPLAELVGWLNDGQKETVLQKPSASSDNVVITLVDGTKQDIGSGRLALLRVVRNITAEGPPRVGGRAIRVCSREILDTSYPDWHDPAITSPNQQVRQYVLDDQDPTHFYVFPPNISGGKVEAIVSVTPALIAPTGDPLDIASYATAIGLPDIYKGALQDYVLYRAYSKDAAYAANVQRAAMHYQQFQGSLGIKMTAEVQQSPNAPAGIVNS